MPFGALLQAITLSQRPGGLAPLIGLGAGNFLGQIGAFEAAPVAGGRAQGRGVDGAVGLMDDRAIGRAGVPDMAGQASCVDAGDADHVLGFEPGIEMLDRAPVGRVGDIGAQHAAACGRGCRLDILGIRADIADMGEGEGDDLPGIGRVGHDFLIAGQRGVEADLADGSAGGADTAAPEHLPIRQHQMRRSPMRAGSGLLARKRPCRFRSSGWWRNAGAGHRGKIRFLGRPMPSRRTPAEARKLPALFTPPCGSRQARAGDEKFKQKQLFSAFQVSIALRQPIPLPSHALHIRPSIHVPRSASRRAARAR